MKLNDLNLQYLKKRRLRNYLALASTIPRNQIVMAAMQLLMSSTRPELRRSFNKLGKAEENEETALHVGLLSTGNVFFRLQRHWYQTILRLRNFLTLKFTQTCRPLFYFRPNMVFWTTCSVPIIGYIHTK